MRSIVRGSILVFASLVALCATLIEPRLARAASPSEGVWGAAPPPPGRFGQAAIYDPVRDRMIMFGGTASSVDVANTFNQVWTLALAGPATWHLAEVAGTPPSGRYRHSVVYDPIRDRLLVFGGYDNSFLLNDVWSLTLSGTPTWTKLTPTGTPPATRYSHVAGYDPVGDRMLVFGGIKVGSVALNDLWALSLAGAPAWSQLAPAGTIPTARGAASIVSDPTRNRLVVFGGNQDNGTFFGDAWALSLAGPLTWSPILAGGSPPSGRAYHSATYDASRDEMLVFAGFDGAYRDDSYVLSFAGTPQWSALSTPGGEPGIRALHSAIHDPVRNRDIVFSGASDVLLSDLWELSREGTPAWSPMPASGDAGLSQRSRTCVVRDSKRGRLILFGGANGVGTLNDLLTLSLAPGQGWSTLAAAGTPPSPRFGASAIYDPVRDRVLVYGGGSGAPGGLLSDLWELSLSGVPTWTRRFPGGLAPGAKLMGSAVYDTHRDRMLLFGGIEGTFDSNSAWALSLSEPMSWAPVNPWPPTAPTGRYAHAAIYDPQGDQMIVFGGDPANNDTYALRLASTPSWQLLSTDGPADRYGASAVYDAPRQRMVIFGGIHSGTDYSDAWSFDLASGGGWIELHPDGQTPAGRSFSSAVYDADTDRMLLVGGESYDGSIRHLYNDVLSLQWSGALGVGPGTGSPRATLSPARPNPARDGVDIAFTLSTGGHARVRLYDVHGRLVRTLADGLLPAGPNLVHWDRRTASGARVAAGLYFFELNTGDNRLTRRVSVTD